jgi:hypothetical protein
MPSLVVEKVSEIWFLVSINTEAKTHDIQVGKTLSFDPGDLLIFDRGYIDYPWLHSLHQKGVWFVTRLKANACFDVGAELEKISPDKVLADQIIWAW